MDRHSPVLLLCLVEDKGHGRIQEGNPFLYKQEYPTETTNVIQESRRNYLNSGTSTSKQRSSSCWYSTNEIFIRETGDAHIYIEGNAHVEIKGKCSWDLQQ